MLISNLLHNGFLEVKLMLTSMILQSLLLLGHPLRNICAKNYHGYVLLGVITNRSFPRS
jgi:hypothetical protein